MPPSVRGLASVRPRATRKQHVLTQRARRTVVWVAAVICLSAISVLMLMTLTALPDLSDVVPKASGSDGYVLLDWNVLERGRRELREGGLSTGTPIRALGYMMQTDQPMRDRQLVTEFVLLPDAGSAFHPAHRFGDQMIDVQLQPGNTVRFSARSLVWVWGVLRALAGNPIGPQPLYRLEHARTVPANRADISNYFQ
jgi:hypothetical protein